MTEARRALQGRAGVVLAALGLGAALLAACGPRPDATAALAAHGPQRLSFTAPDSEPLDPAIERVGTLELPAAAEDWPTNAEQAALVGPMGGRPPALALWGEERFVVRVPLTSPIEPFNLVALELSSSAPILVSVQLVRQGREMLGSGATWMPGTGDPQVLLLELPQARHQRAFLDELRVTFQTRQGTQARKELCYLHRVELLARPLAAFLPDPARGAEPVELGQEEARSAVGLSSRRPLLSSMDVPRGGVLRLAYGLPQTLRPRPGTSADLRLVVRSESGHQEEVRLVPVDWQRAGADWTELEVPLAAFGGQRARLRLELEARGEDEVLLAIAEARVVVPHSNPPTVLLVTTDTHRYDHVSASERDVEVHTPHIDALARRGIYFTNCFSSANSTNPSHVAMLTGRHPRDTGVIDNDTLLAAEAPTLALRFAQAGFTTVAALSARHLGHDASGLGTGFDRISRPRLAQRRSPETLDRLLAWAEALADEPLFVWLHVFDAHTPYTPPLEHLERHWPLDRNPFDPSLPPLEDLPPSIFGPGGPYPGLRDLGFPLAQYRAEVESLDEQLARVLDHPRLGTGVVALIADHGELLGHHEYYYTHGGLYPDSIHVPLALAWPGGPQGLRVERPISHLDLGRTLLDLAGLGRVPFPGRSLTEVLAGDPEPRFSISAYGHAASINLGDWHLVLHLQDNRPHPDPGTRSFRAHQVELFHLGRDPACARDLVDEYPEMARRLRRHLVRWLTSAEPTGWARGGRADDEAIQHLAQLGYTADSFGSPPRSVEWREDGCEWCRRFE